jgi:hypothetical protein
MVGTGKNGIITPYMVFLNSKSRSSSGSQENLKAHKEKLSFLEGFSDSLKTKGTRNMQNRVHTVKK